MNVTNVAEQNGLTLLYLYFNSSFIGTLNYISVVLFIGFQFNHKSLFSIFLTLLLIVILYIFFNVPFKEDLFFQTIKSI